MTKLESLTALFIVVKEELTFTTTLSSVQSKTSPVLNS